MENGPPNLAVGIHLIIFITITFIIITTTANLLRSNIHRIVHGNEVGISVGRSVGCRDRTTEYQSDASLGMVQHEEEDQMIYTIGAVLVVVQNIVSLCRVALF